MKLKLKFVLSIAMLASTLACGPKASDTVEIAVDIGVPVRPHSSAVSLTNNLMDLMSVTLGQDCYQDSIQLIVFDSALQKPITFKKVMLRSIYSGAPPTITNGAFDTDIGTFLTRMSAPYAYLDEPLSIVVPRNKAVEIAVVGAFYSPDAGNTVNQICAQRISTFAPMAASLSGHIPVTSAMLSSGAMNLNIYALVANPNAPYDGLSTRPNITSFTKKQDFAQMDAGSLPTNIILQLKRAHWLLNDQGQFLIHQDLDPIAYTSGNKFYVPHVFPMRLEFHYSGSSSATCSNSSYPCSADYHVDLPENTGSLTSITLTKDLDTAGTSSPATYTQAFGIDSY